MCSCRTRSSRSANQSGCDSGSEFTPYLILLCCDCLVLALLNTDREMLSFAMVKLTLVVS